jgi:hypothetical protein
MSMDDSLLTSLSASGMSSGSSSEQRVPCGTGWLEELSLSEAIRFLVDRMRRHGVSDSELAGPEDLVHDALLDALEETSTDSQPTHQTLNLVSLERRLHRSRETHLRRRRRAKASGVRELPFSRSIVLLSGASSHGREPDDPSLSAERQERIDAIRQAVDELEPAPKLP